MDSFSWLGETRNEQHDPKWDRYFMGIALLSEMRSKDDNTRVGACVVNDEPRVIGIGYNGMPLNCRDSLMPWKEKVGNEKLKYLYVCHAELNAIVNKDPKSVKDCTVYVTLFPCKECAKVIVRSGIKRVVFLSNNRKEDQEYQDSAAILSGANIDLISFSEKIPTPEDEKITEISFGEDEVKADRPKPGEKFQKKDEWKIISWEQYFMALAILSGKVRSEDGKEGACVVNEDKRIVGLGYVQDIRKPPRVDANSQNGKKKDDERKEIHVCHASMMAIVNHNPRSLENCTLYVVQYPCNECAKVIVQSGIRKVVYLEKDERKHTNGENEEMVRKVLKREATERMFAIAGIMEKKHIRESKAETLFLDYSENTEGI